MHARMGDGFFQDTVRPWATQFIYFSIKKILPVDRFILCLKGYIFASQGWQSAVFFYLPFADQANFC
jgi:hypothetical protein